MDAFIYQARFLLCDSCGEATRERLQQEARLLRAVQVCSRRGYEDRTTQREDLMRQLQIPGYTYRGRKIPLDARFDSRTAYGFQFRLDRSTAWAWSSAAPHATVQPHRKTSRPRLWIDCPWPSCRWIPVGAFEQHARSHVRNLAGIRPVPDHPEDESTYDSDQYPKGPVQDGGGASDQVEHCDAGDHCLRAIETPDGMLIGCMLENELTEVGLDDLRDRLREPKTSEHSRFVRGLWFEHYRTWYQLDDCWCRELAGPHDYSVVPFHDPAQDEEPEQPRCRGCDREQEERDAA